LINHGVIVWYGFVRGAAAAGCAVVMQIPPAGSKSSAAARAVLSLPQAAVKMATATLSRRR